MSEPRRRVSPHEPSVGMTNVEACQLRLYVAQGTPNSLRAEQNLTLALAEIGKHAWDCRPEIVDVLTSPRLAVEDAVIVTPTFIGRRGDRRQIILGDLSDTKRLLLFLRSLSSI